MYEQTTLEALAGPVDTERVKREVREFYKTFRRTKTLSMKILDMGQAHLLTKQLYDRHQKLLFDFRTLYAELYEALSPAQQRDVFLYLTDVTPKMINARSQTLGALGAVPFLMIALIVAGSAVTIGVSRIVADLIVEYKTELARQEKEAVFVARVQEDIAQEIISPVEAVEILKARPEGVIPAQPVTRTSLLPGGIVDILGGKLVYVALAIAGVLILSRLGRR